MKKLLLLPFLLLFLVGCNSDDETEISGNLEAQTLLNVAYGNDPQQTMDVYLPENRTADTKVFVLVHGGFWYAGSKEDFNDQ